MVQQANDNQGVMVMTSKAGIMTIPEEETLKVVKMTKCKKLVDLSGVLA